MAKRSKTQRAKASAVRAAKKESRELSESVEETQGEENGTSAKATEKAIEKKSKESDSPAKSSTATDSKKVKKAEEKKPKKQRFQFFRDVRAEMKRVTWPSREDVMRWTGVVAAALVFFGVFVAVLDNLIITPLLVLISGADPSTIDWFSVFTGGDDFNASSSAAVDAGSADAGNVDTSGAGSGTDVSLDTGADSGSSDVSQTEDVQGSSEAE